MATEPVREWIYVQIQIVGNPSAGYDSVYRWNGRRHATRSAAVAAGVMDLEHDDFAIGAVEGKRLVWWGFQEEEHPAEDRAHAAAHLGLENTP